MALVTTADLRAAARARLEAICLAWGATREAMKALALAEATTLAAAARPACTAPSEAMHCVVGDLMVVSES